MEIKLQSKDLLKVLNTTSKAIPQKATIPACEGFLFNAGCQRLSVGATDGNFAIISGCICEGEGEAVIPANTLFALVRTLPATEVTIKAEGNSATIDWGTGNSQLPTFKVEDYPAIPASPANTTTIAGTELLQALKHTIPCVGNDAIRPVMRGVYFNPTEKGLDIVATDSHILTVYSIASQKVDTESFVLPSNAASAVKDAITGDPIEVGFENGVAFFSVGDATICCRTIVGKYPKYDAVIPKDGVNVLKVNVADFISAVKRVSVCSSKSVGSVKFDVDLLGAVATAQDLGFGVAATENLNIVDYNGEKVAVGLKAEYLLKVLNTILDLEVEIGLGDGKKAVLITSQAEPCKSIIMPIAIQ